ncbi:LacI family DNA-binding transcriptional regulator [Sphaerisporangium aureirubrum]|uniref:LacI family DNA-binding transcriptional regulator n=1 Tax=Sphaerisporangium aureirubrum TaxID=1544736 RepID=A0ABW1NLA8_9ACTN
MSVDRPRGKAARPGTAVRMVTVAEVANVSQSVVSKVLNERPGVSDAVRRRVLAAVGATGYEWHRRRPRTEAIEVVFGAIVNAVNAPLLRGFWSMIRDSPFSLTVNHVGADLGWLENLITHRPRGIVLAVSPVPPEVAGRLALARIPTVVVDTIGDSPPEMNAVGATQWRGGAMATGHLTGLGHRRIALLSGPLHMTCCQARFGGYLAALRDAGIRPERALRRSLPFQFPPARRAAHALLDLPDPPTAFVAGNDLQALGVLEACVERGLRVPEDVSVVGYDDLDAAVTAAPALTTVHQPLEEMAAESIRVLNTVIEDPSLAPIRLDLAVDLVIRESTSPARVR